VLAGGRRLVVGEVVGAGGGVDQDEADLRGGQVKALLESVTLGIEGSVNRVPLGRDERGREREPRRTSKIRSTMTGSLLAPPSSPASGSASSTEISSTRSTKRRSPFGALPQLRRLDRLGVVGLEASAARSASGVGRSSTRERRR